MVTPVAAIPFTVLVTSAAKTGILTIRYWFGWGFKMLFLVRAEKKKIALGLTLL
jgi:hypothetical protein